MNIREFEDRVEALKDTDRPYLTPGMVAPVLGWDPQFVRIMAREDPSVFPFPVLTHGRRAQFPKADVLMWCIGYLERLQAIGRCEYDRA